MKHVFYTTLFYITTNLAIDVGLPNFEFIFRQYLDLLLIYVVNLNVFGIKIGSNAQGVAFVMHNILFVKRELPKTMLLGNNY